MKKYLSNIKTDLPAGLVVFLVAIPLCLGIASISGVPIFSGLIAGIVGGIIVGSFSGSQLGVSGPAAGLAVIILNSMTDFGTLFSQEGMTESAIMHEALSFLLLSVVIAGVLQLIAGFFNGGIIGYYFPNSVIKGMLAGIGIVIFLKEIPRALGKVGKTEGLFKPILEMLSNWALGPTLIAVSGIVILLLWERPFMKKIKLFQIIQGPLVAILVGVMLALTFKDNSDFSFVQGHVINVPSANSFDEFVGFFTVPKFSAINEPMVWKTGIVIALVASLETLLCVEATDKLDPQKRVTPTNLELKAQGIGNVVSGLIGGLPITQVIVRSSANIQSGGKTKMSAIFHGLFILGFVGFLPWLLNYIPRASLAAILLVVGFKLAKPSTFKAMWKSGKAQFIPFVVTIFFIVFKDLLWGVGIGLAVAVFEILYLNFRKPYLIDSDPDEKHFVFKLSEDITFLHKASIQQTLNKVPDGSSVVIDGTNSVNIHPDVIEIIENFRTHASYSDINLVLTNIKDVDRPSSMTTLAHALDKVK